MESYSGKVTLGELFKSSSPRSRWSARFENWAKPLSPTEDQKCQNAQGMIEKALEGHRELTEITYKVYPQGSYVANTNVRLNSDVDIRVHSTDTFHYHLPVGVTSVDVGIHPATLDFTTYRRKILTAMHDKFGYQNVQDGNKAINIRENTYRINADVVPAFDYREYFYIGNVLYFRTGSCFFSKSGDLIVNWPDQTLANGKAKNNRTGYRYKKVVRVLKGLKNEMEEKGHNSAKPISSHLIACLAYNVLDSFYGSTDLYDDVKGVVRDIWYHTYDPDRCFEWTEIDEIKTLFPASKSLLTKQVSDFFWELQYYTEMREK